MLAVVVGAGLSSRINVASAAVGGLGRLLGRLYVPWQVGYLMDDLLGHPVISIRLCVRSAIIIHVLNFIQRHFIRAFLGPAIA